MTLLSIESFYVVVGIILVVIAIRIVLDPRHPARWGSSLFWGLFAATFLLGKIVDPLVIGYLVVAMVLLAAVGQVRKSDETTVAKPERIASAERLGSRVFLPALLIPLVVIAGSLFFAHIHIGDIRLVAKSDATLVSLGAAGLVALAAALIVTRASPGTAIKEGSRLLQVIGWSLILPQLLAALGGIFAKAGVGDVVAGFVGDALPTQIPFVAVAAYCVGMALFTMIMGNAFAAFSVITLGIGLPLIVHQHGGNPAIMAALGMLAGYCGTLCTPMAANFNLVPAMLLELVDPHAVIKAQLPFAAILFVFNLLMMWLLVYRF
jgi:uncharacterized membrane protein